MGNIPLPCKSKIMGFGYLATFASMINHWMQCKVPPCQLNTCFSGKGLLKLGKICIVGVFLVFGGEGMSGDDFLVAACAIVFNDRLSKNFEHLFLKSWRLFCL